jgi:transcriptional regulator with XRE-family HTH domain
MAARLGIHRRSVQKWESGETYPTAENLRALIAVLVAHDGFILGQEQAEAEALWQQVSEAAPQPLPPFDTAWFNQWLPVGQPQVDSPAPAAAATLAPPPEPLDPHSSLPPLIASLCGFTAAAVVSEARFVSCGRPDSGG